MYTLAEDAYGGNKTENQCFNEDGNQTIQGLQNISPCQYGAPVYISNPHFYQTDPSLLKEVEGLEPDPELHGTFFKIQPVSF